MTVGEFDELYFEVWHEILHKVFPQSGRNIWFFAIAYEITITYLIIVLEYLSDHTQDITKKKDKRVKFAR